MKNPEHIKKYYEKWQMIGSRSKTAMKYKNSERDQQSPSCRDEENDYINNNCRVTFLKTDRSSDFKQKRLKTSCSPFQN